jgi:hypothetical protein
MTAISPRTRLTPREEVQDRLVGVVKSFQNLGQLTSTEALVLMWLIVHEEPLLLRTFQGLQLRSDGSSLQALDFDFMFPSLFVPQLVALVDAPVLSCFCRMRLVCLSLGAAPSRSRRDLVLRQLVPSRDC